jgi:hypothetical protein
MALIGGSAMVALADFDVRRIGGVGTFGLRWTG